MKLENEQVRTEQENWLLITNGLVEFEKRTGRSSRLKEYYRSVYNKLQNIPLITKEKCKNVQNIIQLSHDIMWAMAKILKDLASSDRMSWLMPP